MKHYCLLFLFILVSLSESQGQYRNVLISTSNSPNEPSIVVDPNNPNIVVAATNLNNYYYSRDGGETWLEKELTSTYGVWGDPTLIVDANSNFYFFHLSNPPEGTWIDRIVCQKSTNNGRSWSPGTFMGKNDTRVQDKQWAVVDRTNNNIYVSWTQFDEYGSTNPNDVSVIKFSKSTDGGDSWSSAKTISEKSGDSMDGDGTVEGAVPAVGPNGEVYVAWAGPEGLIFDRSTDQGETWLDEDIFVSNMPGGWDYNIPGILRANGLPITTCDLSGGPNHGTIYINWSDQRKGTDDTDIWLVKSTDGGDTWSDPIRVNDDGRDKHQFFTWMTVDQANGNLHVVFYDRRNYDDTSTDVYLATSTDGGETFVNEKISQTPFIPRDDIFFGDYTNISAHDGVIRPIWTRLQGSTLSIWTAIIEDGLITNVEDENLSFELEQNYPNPSSDVTYVSFKLRHNTSINLSLYDLTGNEVNRLIDQVDYPYGKHTFRISKDEHNLKAGVYYYSLTIGSEVRTKRMVISD